MDKLAKISGLLVFIAICYAIARSIYIVNMPPEFTPVTMQNNSERIVTFSFGDIHNNKVENGTYTMGGYRGLLAELTGADKKWALKIENTPDLQKFTILENGVPEDIGPIWRMKFI